MERKERDIKVSIVGPWFFLYDFMHGRWWRVIGVEIGKPESVRLLLDSWNVEIYESNLGDGHALCGYYRGAA